MILLLLIAAVLAAGCVYQWWGKRRDARLYPPPGRMIEVGNGTRLHLFETGVGGPAVIFESGLATTSLNWRGLQKSLAGFTRCVAYDRAGLGWSDPCRTPRTPSHIVQELRALLKAAQIEPPYVLVGHSFGGLVVRRYALEYPAEVAGVVLVDPLTSEEADRHRPLLKLGMRVSRRGAILARIGFVRLVGALLLAGSRWLPEMAGRIAIGEKAGIVNRVAGEVGKLPRDLWPMIAAHWSNPKSFAGVAAYFEALPAGADEMRDAPPMDGIPVTLLTAGERQPAIAGLASNVTHLVASRSGHWIHLDEPELVVDAVRQLVARSRTVA
jgi:pimeloyl-ACP methyl ester carboxylesterase